MTALEECTLEDGTTKCVFPFVYKSKTFFGCTDFGSEDGKPWCATEVDKLDKVKDQKWGNCKKDTPCAGL